MMLSAARTLAKGGTSVVVLERETIGWGASSRNAGITGTGLKAGMMTIFKRYGKEYEYLENDKRREIRNEIPLVISEAEPTAFGEE